MTRNTRLVPRLVRFVSRDPSEVAEVLTLAVGRHTVEPSRATERFSARLTAKESSDFSLVCLTMKGRVIICAATGGPFYTVRMRWAGHAETRFRGETVDVSTKWSAILSPGDEVRVRTDEYMEGVGLRIRESAIVREMENCLGHPSGAPLRFKHGMDMRTAFGQEFRQEAIRLCHLANGNYSSDLQHSLAVQQKEKNLVSILIYGHRHNYDRLLHRQSSAALWQVRAVEEFVSAHADEPLSLGDLCRIAGVSARTLQFSFNKHRGCSPTQFWRATRLDRARFEILSLEEPKSITEIATKWGFLHLGRFAAEYAKRFGETPSATLRRTKGYPAPQVAHLN